MNRNSFVVDSDLLHSDFELPGLIPQQIKLDNGLNLYGFRDDSMDVIRMEFLFHKAGSSNQDKIYSSIITNNLITEGTSTHKAVEIANTIDFYGAFIEKLVDKESSSLVFYFLKKYYNELMPWIEEIIKDAIFPQNEINIYTEKLRQQYLLNNQKTDYLARVNFAELIFGETNPLGVKGSLADFDAIERRDLDNFYKSYYNSRNCSVIISGGYDDKILSLINNHIGGNDWAGNSVLTEKDYTKDIEDIKQRKEVINFEQAVQASVRIGKRIISSKDNDYMGVSVLNCLLGGYFGSRLMSNIREDKGYTYGISSILHSFDKLGMFFISADVKAENCQDAINEIYKEIDIISNTLVSKEELDKVRNFLIGNILRSLDGAFELSDRFRPLIKYGFEYDYYEKYINVIRSITPEQIKILSQKYFSLDTMTEVRVGNKKLIV